MPRNTDINAIEESMVDPGAQLSPEEIQLLQEYRQAKRNDFWSRAALTPEQLSQRAYGQAFGGMSDDEVRRQKLIEEKRELQARLLRDYSGLGVEMEKTLRSRIEGYNKNKSDWLDFMSALAGAQGGVVAARVRGLADLLKQNMEILYKNAPVTYDTLDNKVRDALGEANKFISSDGTVIPLTATSFAEWFVNTYERAAPQDRKAISDYVSNRTNGAMSARAIIEGRVTTTPAQRTRMAEATAVAKDDSSRRAQAVARAGPEAENLLTEINRQGVSLGPVFNMGVKELQRGVEWYSNPEGPPPQTAPPPPIESATRGAAPSTDQEPEAAPGGAQAPSGAPSGPAPGMGGTEAGHTSTSGAEPGGMEVTKVTTRGPTSGAQSRLDAMYASLEREIADLENKSWDPAVVQKRRAVMQTQGFRDFAARFNLQNDLDTAFRLYLRQAKKELREQTDLGAGAFHKAAKEGKVSLLPSPEDYEDMAADEEFERTLTARGRESGQRAREDRLAREEAEKAKARAWREREIEWAEGKMSDEEAEAKRQKAAETLGEPEPAPKKAPPPKSGAGGDDSEEWKIMEEYPNKQRKKGSTYVSPAASSEAASMPADRFFRQELLNDYEEPDENRRE